MKIIVILTLIFCFALGENLKGTAVDAKGKTVYTEIHEVERSTSGLTTRVKTIYFKPDGNKLGHLISEFKGRPYLPDSEFEDLRFGRKYTGKLNTKKEKPVYTIEEYKNGELIKSTDIDLKEDLISGPGFDNFISEEIYKNRKAKIPVHFLVLPRHTDYRFEVSQFESSEQTRQYKIKPTTLLSLFVKDILISYDVSTGLLKSYEGLSNLPSDNDGPQNVTIRYIKHAP